jgi:hypothetical protein
MSDGLVAFVRRWRYTITGCLLLVTSTALLLAVQPGHWWVPTAFAAGLMAITWPGWRR